MSVNGKEEVSTSAFQSYKLNFLQWLHSCVVLDAKARIPNTCKECFQDLATSVHAPAIHHFGYLQSYAESVDAVANTSKLPSLSLEPR